jgi:hypothetical protein
VNFIMSVDVESKSEMVICRCFEAIPSPTCEWLDAADFHSDNTDRYNNFVFHHRAGLET